MIKRLLFLVSIIYISLNNSFAQPNDPLVAVDSMAQQQWVDSVFNTLTLRQRIAQLFMVAAYSNRSEVHVNEIDNLIINENIGGLIFFQGGPVRQANLTNRYQSLSKVPLMIGMDAEWGLGMRLDSTFSYPRQMMMGAQSDSVLAYNIANDIAQHLKRMGVHVNFAPVVDVNNNPQNPVIHTRAFGENTSTIVRYGTAYMAAMQNCGIMAVAKHFPGHGDTFVDSHLDMPTVLHDSARLHNVELFPFKQLINNGVQGVMVSHLKVPSLEPDTLLPATLSDKILNQLLKKQFGFNGLVFTDAMNMKGLTNYFENVDANVRAILAGNDVIEFALDVKPSIDKIEAMVTAGEIDQSIIDSKCRKVLKTKYLLGLNRYKPIDTKDLYSDLNTTQSVVLRRKLITNALTLLSNYNSIIPLKRLDTLNIALVEVGSGLGNDFYRQLACYANISKYSIDASAPDFIYDSLSNQLDGHNLIIVACHKINNYVKSNYGVSLQLANFIFDLSFRKKVILDVFGNPYSLTKFYNLSSVAATVVSYDNSEDVQNLSAQLIFGGIAAHGKIPVSMSKAIVEGAGCNIERPVRLAYSIPEELGINSNELLAIDSIAQVLIDSAMAPGMQVLAAKDGVVFYNKCFGRPTYQSSNEVDAQMLYDVASVTKVTATLPLVMRLYDRKQLSLTSTLGEFTNLQRYPDKSKIVIRDLLLHRAGLVPWIPFYLGTLSTIMPNAPLFNPKQTADYPYKISAKKYMNKFVCPSTKYYSTVQSIDFPTKVADNLFAIEGIVDSMFMQINSSAIKNKGRYVYSDFSFIYLQRVVENIEQDGLSNLADSLLYQRLGMNYTCFNPLNRFNRSQIVPTEYDVTFRKQLVWGYVHDPAAAMFGGVSGHAGIFSNANDLAKIMQMYIWRGEYGGERYFSQATVDLFTSKPADNGTSRRALGFDRPDFGGKSTPCGTLASAQSYGHLGFTGDIVWADSENGLVYILLSNRVYPDANNSKMMKNDIRTKIHDVFYRAIKNAGTSN